MPSPRIRVVVSDAHGRRLKTAGLSTWLARVAPATATGQVNVALVSDARIRALNRRYRRHDSATDVLSFPNATDRARGRRQFASGSRCLGDIVIARGVAGRQARANGHDESTELRVLALHGLLHLLGYDHHDDNGTMFRVERRLRKKGGLPEGLIERAQP